MTKASKTAAGYPFSDSKMEQCDFYKREEKKKRRRKRRLKIEFF